MSENRTSDAWVPVVLGRRSQQSVRMFFPKGDRVKKGHSCAPVKSENMEEETGRFFKDDQVQHVSQNVEEAEETQPDTSSISLSSNKPIEQHRKSEMIAGLNTDDIFGGPNMNPQLVKLYIDEIFKQNMNALTAKRAKQSIYLPPSLQQAAEGEEITFDRMIIRNQQKLITPKFATVKRELFIDPDQKVEQGMQVPEEYSTPVEPEPQPAPAAELKRMSIWENAPIELNNAMQKKKTEFVVDHLLQPRRLEDSRKRKMFPPVAGKKRIRAKTCANDSCECKKWTNGKKKIAIHPRQPTNPATTPVSNPVGATTMATPSRAEDPTVGRNELEQLRLDNLRNQQEQERKKAKKIKRELRKAEKRKSQLMAVSTVPPTYFYSVQERPRLILKLTKCSKDYVYFN